MTKKNKLILTILTILLVLFCINLKTKADSGWDSDYDSGSNWDSGGSSWDSDYDSGSSWDSGGSWDFGSDWGSSSGSHSSSYSSNGELGNSIIIIIFIFIVIIVISILSQRKKMKIETNRAKTIINNRFCKEMFEEEFNTVIKDTTMEELRQKVFNIYKEISEEEFNTVIKDTTMEELKQKVFNIYKEIQYSWTNFDYENLRLLTTDEIYNMYTSQLNALEIKNQVNIMSEIDKKDVRILSVKEENSIITVEAYLKVTCYDYVINKNTNEVLRGMNNNKMELEYIITLVKDKNSKNSKTVKCPNCGAEVEMTSSGKCKYCEAVLVQKASDYVMSKKECIGQRTLL